MLTERYWASRQTQNNMGVAYPAVYKTFGDQDFYTSYESKSSRVGRKKGGWSQAGSGECWFSPPRAVSYYDTAGSRFLSPQITTFDEKLQCSWGRGPKPHIHKPAHQCWYSNKAIAVLTEQIRSRLMFTKEDSSGDVRYSLCMSKHCFLNITVISRLSNSNKHFKIAFNVGDG